MDLTPLQLQLNVYPPAGAFGDWVALLSHFSGKAALGRAEHVTLLPLGADAPQEIPRLAMAFPQVGLQLEASGVVWALRWIELPTAKREDAYAVGKRQMACQCLVEAASHFRIRIVRLASVTTWALAELVEPAKWLASRFFREQYLAAPLNRPETLEIHSHKVFSFAQFTVNSWARLKTERLLQADNTLKSNRVVTFASDLNTLVTEKNEFSFDQATAFFEQTWAQHVEVRRLYIGE